MASYVEFVAILKSRDLLEVWPTIKDYFQVVEKKAIKIYPRKPVGSQCHHTIRLIYAGTMDGILCKF